LLSCLEPRDRPRTGARRRRGRATPVSTESRTWHRRGVRGDGRTPRHQVPRASRLDTMVMTAARSTPIQLVPR